MVPVSGAGEVVDVPARDWHAAAAAAHEDGLTWFGWLTAVDDPAAGSMTVLLSVSTPEAPSPRLLRSAVPRMDGSLASVGDLYPGAVWAERETAEMFGVRFDGGHPGRLLLPGGAPTHPLRKDTVLVARQVVPWPGDVEPGGRARRRPTPPGVVPGWVEGP